MVSTTEQSEEQKQGTEFFRAGNYAKAIYHYNRAIKAEPENHVLFSNRSAAFLKLNQPKQMKALEDAQTCVKLQPTWAKGYFRLGLAHASLRQFDESITAFNKCKELDPENKEIARQIKTVRTAQKDSNALSKLYNGTDMPIAGLNPTQIN